MFVPNKVVKNQTWAVSGFKPETKKFMKRKGYRKMRRALKLSIRSQEETVKFRPK